MSSNGGEIFEWKILDKRQKSAGDWPGEPQESGNPRFRLAVLVSGSGSNLQALIDAIESKELPGVEIALVASNNIDAYGLERAHKHSLQSMYLPWKHREESEAKLTTWLQLFHVDLIVLAGREGPDAALGPEGSVSA